MTRSHKQISSVVGRCCRGKGGLDLEQNLRGLDVTRVPKILQIDKFIFKKRVKNRKKTNEGTRNNLGDLSENVKNSDGRCSV